MKYLIPLHEAAAQDPALVGGKAAVLARLMQTGLVVPPGLVVTTAAYHEFHASGIPAAIQAEITTAVEKLGAPMLAVRSSAVQEDSQHASWAGQFTTLLQVKPSAVMSSIEQCWASLQSEHSQAYAARQQDMTQPGMAVIVQAMIPSQVAGVLFTKNPLTQATDQYLLEAVAGLGEQLAQGEVTPSSFLYDMTEHQVVSHTPGDQEEYLGTPLLTDALLTELMGAGERITQLFGQPQDIEWAIVGERIYILQSRPITT